VSVKRWHVKWDETEVPDGEYVLAADFDRAVELLRELTAYADGMNPVPPIIARSRQYLAEVDK
jgi:hypothetical protein